MSSYMAKSLSVMVVGKLVRDRHEPAPHLYGWIKRAEDIVQFLYYDVVTEGQEEHSSHFQSP